MKSSVRSLCLIGGGLALVVSAIALLFAPAKNSSSSTHKSNQRQTAALSKNNLAEEWSAAVRAPKSGDLPNLIRKAILITDPDLRQRMLVTLVMEFMNQDLRGFIAFLDDIDSDSDSSAAMWRMLAPALLAALPQVHDRTTLSSSFNEIVQRALAAQAEIDPQIALKWAREWLIDDSLQAAMAKVVAVLVHDRVDSAIEIFNQIKSPLRRMEALDVIGSTLAAEDPAHAVTWARSLRGPSEKARGMNTVLSELATQQPEQAATLLTDFKVELQTDYNQRVIAERQSLGTDARNELNDPESDQAVMAADGAATASPTSPDVELLDDAAAAIARQLSATDPTSAMKWAASLDNSQLRQSAQAAVWQKWATQHPSAAVNDFLASDNPNPTLASGLFGTWAQSDPVAAASTATMIATASVRKEALQGAVESWLESDRDSTETVSAWASQLPASPARDETFATIADSQSAVDPAEALKTANTISDAKLRSQTLRQSFVALLAQDPQAARKFAQTSRSGSEEALMFQKLLQAAGDL